MKPTSIFALLASVGLVSAQGLSDALQKYPEASTFVSRLADLAPDLANRTADQKYTILVPTNDAFKAFATSHQAIDALPEQDRKAYFRYHVLYTSLTSSNFSAPAGLTVPTLLKDELYNNRTVGDQITSVFGKNANGQVLYIAKDLQSTSSRKFKVKRQISPGGTAQVRAGLAENATITAVDGKWDGGSFHLVDTLLTPPAPCSKTIRSRPELSALDNALNRSSLWTTLDHMPNVTCLAPISSAFKAAGDPDQKLSQSDLVNALTFHTLPTPQYSNFLTDGLQLKSLANLTIKVTVNSSGTWFNDAKVLQKNVLTNNGLIHVLDKIMSPINNEKLPTNSSGGSGSSGSKPSMASGLTMSLYQPYVAAILGIAGLLIMQ